MVDFKKLRNGRTKSVPIQPRDIFNALPKPAGINDLYVSQAEVLDEWFERRTDKDVVVKLHTGGGKTLVALLMAQSVMNETGEPVVYLAPTIQLVDQVLAQSREYGIPCVTYIKGGTWQSEFLDGKSVLIGTYRTLFNGRSRFGVRGSRNEAVNAGAIILDDAHVALSSVRDAFTLTITATEHYELYTELADRFRYAFMDVGRLGMFEDIICGKEYGVIEVPSWSWHRKHLEIQGYLAAKVEEVDQFIWPLLRDNLECCHCIFSRAAVTITPIFPTVDLLPTFDDCRRRIYMSATIADDSEIVRTFGASKESVSLPITSRSLAGVGERMILVPGLMDLGGVEILAMIKRIATKLSEKALGSLILSPSGTTASHWTDIADYPDTTGEVSKRVSEMQTGEVEGPVVLANRYDGIDLPGNSCRFLVMDDLPQGSTNYEAFRMNVMADAAIGSFLAHRIEQGIGRGTRGGADYCVVVLLGSKLGGWVGTRKNLDFLTANTRVQLKMGQEVSGAVTTIQEFWETILKCLERDHDWVAYHASELSEAANLVTGDTLALRVAAVERKAFKHQRLGEYRKAITLLENTIADEELTSDKRWKAWLAAEAARISFQMNDDQKGQDLQTKAFAGNNNHCPPKRRQTYVTRPMPSTQSTAIVNYLQKYEPQTAILNVFNEAMCNLIPQASASQYEEAVAELGSFLGFDAERPDNEIGVGPDVLWRTEGPFDFLIEVKSKKNEDSPLYKKDQAQLLHAEHWFEETYPNRKSKRISALPQALAESKSIPAGTLAFRLHDIDRMVGKLRDVLYNLAWGNGETHALREQCEVELLRAKLTPTDIPKEFMKPFRNASSKPT